MPQLAESADDGQETIAKNLAQRWDLLRILSKPRMLILGFFTLFRDFELSYFRDWFSSLIREKRNHQEDHENTKVRKHEKMPSLV